jgi:hypothetical protein
LAKKADPYSVDFVIDDGLLQLSLSL